MKLSELKKQLENCADENERKALEKEIAKKEYQKEYQRNYKRLHNDKYKEYRKEYYKEYYKTYKDELKKYQSQMCCYNGETLKLYTLVMRFKRQGIEHPTLEAKKYIVEQQNN